MVKSAANERKYELHSGWNTPGHRILQLNTAILGIFNEQVCISEKEKVGYKRFCFFYGLTFFFS